MKKLLLITLCYCSLCLVFASDVPFFIPNKGQLLYTNNAVTNEILYYNNFSDVKILFKKDRISYIFEKKDPKKLQYWQAIADTNIRLADKLQESDSTYYYQMDMIFVNSNPKVILGQEEISETYYLYYLPQSPDGLKVFPSSKLIYKDIYPGIDIIFFQNNGKLKYDIIIKPGADPNKIQFEFKGADLEKTNEDEITVKTPTDSWTEFIPRSYTYSDGDTSDTKVTYNILKSNILKFSIENYDPTKTLVIDPSLTWSTYFNIQQNILYGQDAAAWNDRVAYLTTAGAQTVPSLTAGTGAYFQNTHGGASYDFVILMFNTKGVLLWATFYGGSENEYLKGNIRFDSQGRIYLTGMSQSNNIPLQTMAGAHNDVRTGYYEDIFLARFDQNGIRQWATMIDTDYYADKCALAIGPNDNIFIAGYFSLSYKFGTNFTLKNPAGGAYYQNTRTFSGTTSLFNDESYILEFNSNGQAIWGTYFGNNADEKLSKITVTPNGGIFLAGSGNARYASPSNGAPYQYYPPILQSAGQHFDNNHNNGANKLYLIKFNANRSLAWASYFGNPASGQGYNQSYQNNLLSDSQNNVYIVDGTTDNTMPIKNLAGAYNQASGIGSSGTKLCIVKFSNNTQLLWSTYFSGTETNGYWRPGATIGSNDELYVVAGTNNSDHPTQNLPGAYFQAASNGGRDGIIAKFESTGKLAWSTYVGGINSEEELNCVASTGASDCYDKTTFAFGKTGGTTWNGGGNSWPIVNPGGGAHIENYPGSGYNQIAIARFSEQKNPTLLAIDNDVRTCPCSGNSFTHFIPSGTDRIIASINPNGQDLGNTTVTAYVQTNAFQLQDCNNTSANFNVAAMSRRFKITPTTQPSSNVSVRFYYSTSEFSALQGASLINSNPNDNISSATAFGELKTTRFSASAGNSAIENGNFPDNCGKGTFNLHNNAGTGTASSLFTGFNANGRYVEFSVPGFSEFWLHGKIDNTPLPVELLTFSAYCQENAIRINWSTVSEQNNAYFQIEKSNDGANWSFVKRVSGAGNSNSYLTYEITDEQIVNKNTIYRLSQIDFDGTITYFDPYSVKCDITDAALLIFPNPAQSEVTISVTSSTNFTNATLQITDITGKTMHQQNIQLSEGANHFNLPTNTWADGMYFVTINHEELKLPSQKLMIRK